MAPPGGMDDRRGPEHDTRSVVTKLVVSAEEGEGEKRPVMTVRVDDLRRRMDHAQGARARRAPDPISIPWNKCSAFEAIGTFTSSKTTNVAHAS